MLRYIILCCVVTLLLFFVSRHFKQKRLIKQGEYESMRRDAVTAEDNFNTIFIAIPCYREEHSCAETLFSLLNEASCPWRVRVTVFHHVHPTDNNFSLDITNLYEHIVLQHGATSFQSQIKIVQESNELATGSWNARVALLKGLFQQERFFMTMTCHAKMVQKWDAICLQQYTRCLKHSARPILTTCPATYDPQAPLENMATYPRLTSSGLTAEAYVKVPVRPFPSPVVVPKFIFCSSRLVLSDAMLMDMPFVNDNDILLLLSARLYTYGWDFYTPTVPILYNTEHGKLNLFVDRPELRLSHTQQVSKLQGMLNPAQCEICEEDESEHVNGVLGHTFESWSDRHVFGFVRPVTAYFIFASKSDLGITSDTTAEEQIAKFDKVIM